MTSKIVPIPEPAATLPKYIALHAREICRLLDVDELDSNLLRSVNDNPNSPEHKLAAIQIAQWMFRNDVEVLRLVGRPELNELYDLVREYVRAFVAYEDADRGDEDPSDDIIDAARTAESDLADFAGVETSAIQMLREPGLRALIVGVKIGDLRILPASVSVLSE